MHFSLRQRRKLQADKILTMLLALRPTRGDANRVVGNTKGGRLLIPAQQWPRMLLAEGFPNRSAGSHWRK